MRTVTSSSRTSACVRSCRSRRRRSRQRWRRWRSRSSRGLNKARLQKRNAGVADDGNGDDGSSGTRGAWLAGHRIRLPAFAEQQHAAWLKRHAAAVMWDKVTWRILREVQAEDEARARRMEGKRMPHLTTAQHIRKTGFSCMKVGPALRVLSLDTANQMRLRRHGGWQ